MSFAAGQAWAYRSPEGFDHSCIVIGAIVRYEERESIICFCVYNAPRTVGSAPEDTVTVPFIPMSESAFAGTVTALVAHEADLPETFADQLHAWSNDERGLAVFTVPFLGTVNQMMTMQVRASQPAAYAAGG
jgi:hypothetical protein